MGIFAKPIIPTILGIFQAVKAGLFTHSANWSAFNSEWITETKGKRMHIIGMEESLIKIVSNEWEAKRGYFPSPPPSFKCPRGFVKAFEWSIQESLGHAQKLSG
ncbi:hypothetical protein CEXT_414391 [Caerostris extrusa]|uniref:Uncharacterized protein n=1 Tax=Caerostris extrusa TaxID=172846 RepID=A0AAV4NUV8_CAEEX|nr:hypothetical protein CEXT_414391 [Caerostris extrusa]